MSFRPTSPPSCKQRSPLVESAVMQPVLQPCDDSGQLDLRVVAEPLGHHAAVRYAALRVGCELFSQWMLCLSEVKVELKCHAEH
jgi:hypothetical protein